MTMKPLFRPLFCATAAVVSLASSARADWVLDWNNAALSAIEASGQSSAEASRTMAILDVAIYDALVGVTSGYTSFRTTGQATAGANDRAAVAAAANTVMSQLFPTMTSSFASIYSDQMSSIGNGVSKDNGVNWGVQVATQMLSWRQTDGSANAASTPYNPSGAYGRWAPTPSSNPVTNYQNPPTLPGWSNVTPFGMSSGSQYRPGASPALTAVAYATAYNEVLNYGAKYGSARSTDQTVQAFYWSDQTGLQTQVAHWNQIAGTLLGANLGLLNEARVTAALNVALADAGITAWDAKYAYDTWRPITAIAYGDNDGNDLTSSDIFWEPLIDALPTPEYLSEVGTMSTAAGEVLKHYFGDIGFSALGDSDGNGTQDTLRNFTSISQAVAEANLAGVYAGDHFRFVDPLTGLSPEQSAGGSIGQSTVTNYFQELALAPEPSSLLFVGLAGVLSLRRRRA